MFMNRFKRITQKLDHLRHIDTNHTIFGADVHQYRLNPCLNEAQIFVFEQSYAIRLPYDYRSFLHLVGNGGAGPYYGITPLERSLRDWCAQEDPAYPSKAFPLQENLVLYTLDSATDFDRYMTSFYTQGTIDICDYGCGIYFMLIMTGTERGNIWVDDRASDGGIFALTQYADRHTPVDFLTWYENWLDTSIHTVQGVSEENEHGYLEYGFVKPKS
jgi:SMI1 / KNR4 family (SUKH-1)